jgi:hypothetical protein
MAAMEYAMSVPFGWTKISAGEVATFESSPAVPFSPDRLMIPSIIGHSFEILDVTIDGVSVLVWPAPLQAGVFAETNKGPNLKATLCRPSGVVAIKVKNVNDVAKEFVASAVGRVFE